MSPWLSHISAHIKSVVLTALFSEKKVKSLSHVQLFAIPWTVAYQAPSSMEFSRQEYWSGLPFPSPGDLPDPGIEPGSPALQADTLPSEAPGKPFFPEKSLKEWVLRKCSKIRNNLPPEQAVCLLTLLKDSVSLKSKGLLCSPSSVINIISSTKREGMLTDHSKTFGFPKLNFPLL